ncbi:alternative ribosome rescue factor ArfA [Candidatus Pelagibacter sp.]|nr:alternative ribosome rescue factor ArfA [Candidatus Pelagibacter sp.]
MKKNPVAKTLSNKQYKPKIVKPKKGKGSFKRKKLKSSSNLLNNF